MRILFTGIKLTCKEWIDFHDLRSKQTKQYYYVSIKFKWSAFGWQRGQNFSERYKYL